MLFLNIVILAVITIFFWWVTGKDKSVSGESKRDRHLDRPIRCLIVLFLATALLWFCTGAKSPRPRQIKRVAGSAFAA